jgi:hypothetical protein
MKIEEIVKKYINDVRKRVSEDFITNSLKSELKKEGHEIEKIEVTSRKIVVRTANEVFVQTV